MLQIRSLSWDTLAKAKSLSFTVNDVSKRLKVNRNAQDYVLRLDLQNFGKFQFVWTKLKTSLVHYFPFPYPPIYGKSMFFSLKRSHFIYKRRIWLLGCKNLLDISFSSSHLVQNLCWALISLYGKSLCITNPGCFGMWEYNLSERSLFANLSLKCL